MKNRIPKYVQEIARLYNVDVAKVENLRKRTGERLNVASQLYGWEKSELPSIENLLKYQLNPARRYRNTRAETILSTATAKKDKSGRYKTSIAAKLTAINNYAGYGTLLTGFGEFAQGIIQFETLYSNTLNILSNNPERDKLAYFKVNEPLSVKKDRYMYIVNNPIGRESVVHMNQAVEEYNRKLPDLTQQNALEEYLHTVRSILYWIDYAESHDATAGS
ncbi:MAG: hypothetical protein KBS70_07360 [Bacteroidales bacterium]|nr:hypothetical protein [Candidatus Colicola equi]